MNRRALIALASTGLAPLLASQSVAADDKVKSNQSDGGAAPASTTSSAWMKGAIEPGGFVVAYYLRDPDDKDGRPPLPKDPQDPLGSDGSWVNEKPGKDAGSKPTESAVQFARSIGYRILKHPGHLVLDLAALITRKVKEVRVPEVDAAALMAALMDNPMPLILRDCYSPRHLVVYYDPDGQPKAALEICFECESYRVVPAVSDRAPETGDLVLVARLFDKLGLPLGKDNLTLKAYEERVREQRADAKAAGYWSAPGTKPEAR